MQKHALLFDWLKRSKLAPNHIIADVNFNSHTSQISGRAQVTLEAAAATAAPSRPPGRANRNECSTHSDDPSTKLAPPWCTIASGVGTSFTSIVTPMNTCTLQKR
ncbi:unnamed protein product [Phytophthora fragariaefolia]|uniref:Unnamed protein product n=1 Tax=Phytophthora fragariaefolia TaxID=1490495 RepID=A0A9W6UEA5_9STRA|nr:unnamed protein product [Phytophthora fragariaefolia]